MRISPLYPAAALLAALTVFAGNLRAKEIRENPVQKKLERYLPYSIDEIEASAASINFNPRLVAEELGQKLDQFYLSDPSEKKIANRQDNDSNAAWYRKEWNVNLQRLFMRDLLARTQKSFIIKEAPNLAVLHYNFALAQMKLKKPYHAAFHFAQSLRYRSLRLDDEIYVDRDRLQLTKAGAAEIADADAYREAKKQLDEKTREKRRLEEELVLLDDRSRSPELNAPSTTGNSVEAQRQKQQQLIADQREKSRQALQRVRDEFEKAKQAFDNAKIKYTEHEKTYNRKSSDMLIEMAALVRQIEDTIKERSKVLNKKALYKTNFNQTLQHDYSQNRQFTAFANVLEAATRLDPENPAINFQLAEEYRTSQDVSRSIDSYERALTANEKPRPGFELKDEQIRKAHASLGALYYAKSRYVDAAFFYEKAHAETPNSPEKQNLSWQLGKLHVEKTGNYERAAALFEEYLRSIATLNPSDVSDRTQWIKERFTANKYLMHIYGKKSDKTQVMRTMQGAAAAHQDLETLITELRQRNNKTYNDMQVAKKALFDDVRSRELNNYLKLESDFEKQKRELAIIEAGRNSLPLAQFYSQYAGFLESENDIQGALAVYGTAEKHGLGADHARREQGRLRAQYLQ
ncbi:Tetratricopeptide TPR_1 repeat-containing protein [Turneriella parva DSM 21527]|uniref:Tetratricopeptide TPR_1 repeat-containing protein n=1 Tax=Turneriella parva (strain ATCC BAA-1111 / DSM 21527 / NCTC 11395 / H) TaxID=869212 RepID=I4B2C8_TURPD|nr:Tetratricopeptide TPR_1 repeat-containing protein [Turneriella parva DSM 21527]